MYSLANKTLFPKRQSFAMDQLSTSDLQLLASAHGRGLAWQHKRAAVLSVVNDELLRDELLRPGPKVWLVENAKVVCKPTSKS